MIHYNLQKYSDARFYVANRFVDTNKLNIDCGNSSVSCQSTEITCLDNGAKGGLQYNDTLMEWVCQRKGCCPWETNNITCTAGVDCQLDCSMQDCIGYILDARQATSLTLGCTGGSQFGGSYTCEGLHILAPLATDASITLNCLDTHACIGAKIITENNDN